MTDNSGLTVSCEMFEALVTENEVLIAELEAAQAVVKAARWAAVQPDATFAMITLRNVLEEEGFAALDAPPEGEG